MVNMSIHTLYSIYSKCSTRFPSLLLHSFTVSSPSLPPSFPPSLLLSLCLSQSETLRGVKSEGLARYQTVVLTTFLFFSALSHFGSSFSLSSFLKVYRISYTRTYCIVVWYIPFHSLSSLCGCHTSYIIHLPFFHTFPIWILPFSRHDCKTLLDSYHTKNENGWWYSILFIQYIQYFILILCDIILFSISTHF